MNLSLRQLRVFLLVSRVGNFTRAAEQAHMTQAGLSIMMREMEKQIGCRLFDRTTRMVALTDAGRDLLPVVERVVSDMDGAVAQLSASGRTAWQTLRVAATPLVSANVMPRVLARLRVSHPHLKVTLSDGDISQVQQQVSGGDADVGLGFFFKQVSGIVRSPLGTFRLMRVSASAEPQTFRTGKTPWSSLRDVPLIGLPAANPIQQLVERHLATIGRANEARPSFNFLDTLVSMVEAGLGDAVIPSVAMVACQRHRVSTELLIRPAVSLDIFQIKRRGQEETEAAQVFRQVLGEELSAHVGSD